MNWKLLEQSFRNYDWVSGAETFQTGSDLRRFIQLANTRSAQMELEHNFLEPQAFGPIRARTRWPLGLTAGVLRGLERGQGEWRDGDLVGRVKSL